MVTHLVDVHDRALCAGHPCCVHNPSDHHMYGWRQHWRADRRLMERLCAHGIGHPDPDDVAYARRQFGEVAARLRGFHGCDGCCASHGDGDDDG